MSNMRTWIIILLVAFLPLSAAALQVNGNISQPNCGLANCSVNAYASGGQAPYTWVWSPAPATGQGTSQITGLLPGTWTATVTDNLGEQATHDFILNNIQSITNAQDGVTWGYNMSAAHHPCPGYQNGSIALVTSILNGTPPYTVDLDGQPPIGYDQNSGYPFFGYFSVGDQIYLNVTDANGCAGFAQVIIDSPTSLGTSASNINPACGGLYNGSADISFGFAGPYGPSLWVGGPSGQVYSSTPTMEPLQLTGLQAGQYSIYGAYSATYFPDPGCDFNGNFEIPDLGPDCGTVTGRLFIDNNQNCAQNAGEPNVPYHVIEIDPGPEYAITNANGIYTRNLINGNFSVQAQGTGTELYPLCPAVQPAPFTINYNTVTVDLADSSLVPLDVQLTASNSVARPGFVQSIWGTARNLSAQISGSVSITLLFDAQMSYLSASPPPTSVSGNTITWELPAFIAFSSQNFAVQLQVPADVGLIGQPFAHSVSISQSLTESTYANNSVALNGSFQGSYDPNDKRARTSSGTSNEYFFINDDQWIDYTIRFQNTGTDTAFTVVVTDTLPATLDIASFEMGTASHPFEVYFRTGRVVEWRFPNILLPDSNVNEAGSHGLLSFRIKPVQPLLSGTSITNTANIYFDFNEPVITGPSVLTAEFSTAAQERAKGQEQLVLLPNPAMDHLRISSEGTMRNILIIAADGREVLRVSPNTQSSLIDVSGLSVGPYVVLSTLYDGTLQRGRFIKQ